MAELFANKKIVGGIAAAALAVVIGGVSLWQGYSNVPELPQIQDPIMEVTLEKEETPLAAKPKTTTKTSTKTTKKNVKMKTAAKKTYSKSLPTTTKTSTKTSKNSKETIKTQTTTKTAVTEKYTKKSKIKVVTTKVTTTVKTTTTPIASKSTSAATTTAAKTTAKKAKYEITPSSLAPKMDKRVLSAYEKMGFKAYVDSSVSYAGYFNAKDRSITMREESDNMYHELGHFLAFISGNTDQTSAFKAIYSQEMSKYTGYNKAYVTQNNAEYFAESTKDYILNGAALKASRPNTYAAIESALSKVTDAQINKLMKLYASVWK